MSTTAPQSDPSDNGLTHFSNPVIWEDLPDMDIIRLGDIYHMSVSSFAFSPGAPILQSRNLIDWEYIGHSVPELAFGERFYLDGQHTGAYVKGVWASSMQYRKSNKLFYWYGPIQGTERTYIYTAKDPKDVWTPLPPIDKFFYDLGLLIDTDDTMYLAYGTKTISVSQLSEDGTKEVKTSPVYTSDEYLEGARMYNINGTYYIWLVRPHAGQYVLKSSSGPFGPYECRRVLGDIRSPIPGAGCPHQGALIDTPDGKWYYMAFMDGYPCGRIPVLAPVTFNEEGWPEVDIDYTEEPGVWRRQHPRLSLAEARGCPTTCFRKHSFNEEKLDVCWQWNHNPDNTRWSLQNGNLILETGTVTESLYSAPNTLTHRTIGPKSMATFCLDTSSLIDGDRAGACIFRDKSAYIGIHQDADSARLVYVDDLTMAPFSIQTGWSNGHPVALDWSIKSNGSIEAETPLLSKRVYLRVKADVAPAFSHGYEKEPRYTTFEFSYDGKAFTQLGLRFLLPNTADGFVGFRFGVFNFATKALGGALLVESCDVSSWEEQWTKPRAEQAQD